MSFENEGQHVCWFTLESPCKQQRHRIKFITIFKVAGTVNVIIKSASTLGNIYQASVLTRTGKHPSPRDPRELLCQHAGRHLELAQEG